MAIDWYQIGAFFTKLNAQPPVYFNMEDFDITLSLNGKQIAVKVHPFVQEETTHYTILFDDYSIDVFKDTLYTWATDDAHGLNQADIQSIGEQIENN
jgi:hypothetical protein